MSARRLPGSPARVALLVGAGGLGSAAAFPLARSGRVRRIVVCDPDTVEISNLHRQILHRTIDARAAGDAGAADHARGAGRPKVESAADAIRRLAPDVDVIAVRASFDASTAPALLAGVDVVLDGSDNFAAKFLVNDSCVLARVPFVHAAAVRWSGQLLAVDPRSDDIEHPCYRCLFEAPPPAQQGASCREAGVVGPVVGVVGALQAEAAIALLDGEHVGGRLLVYDGLRGSTRVVRFRKNPECIACGAPRGARLDAAPQELSAC